MNISTITEAGAELIHRGLKFAEADIIKFRTSAEARGFKHTVDECNDQLKILRGNGAEPGLLSQFAPQLDAFEAGSLAGDGSGEDGQLALASEDDDFIGEDEPNVRWAKFVPRPRPKKGQSIIFPDGSTGSIDSVRGFSQDRGEFDVFFRGAEADEDLTAPPTKLSIIHQNGEWRSSDEERAGNYAQRDEELSAQRKLGDDTVVDADVPVNAETEQGQVAPRSRSKLNRAASKERAAAKPKAKAKPKAERKGGKKARS